MSAQTFLPSSMIFHLATPDLLKEFYWPQSHHSQNCWCWNSKCRQPDTSTSVHLYIDGFSCHYQLMPLAGMFIPVILFHDHMILFSDSPLTTRFRIFHPFYILSCSFLAPQTLYHIWVWHLRWATLYTWYFVLYHIDYVPVAIIFTGEYTQTLYHIRVRHLSYHIYRFRRTRFASWSQLVLSHFRWDRAMDMLTAFCPRSSHHYHFSCFANARGYNPGVFNTSLHLQNLMEQPKSLKFPRSFHQ